MRKLRFGVIGAGGIARRKTIPGMLQAANCELAAVMDVANIEAIAREFGVAKAYDNETQLLADPSVEAVYIASPVCLHASQILAAAERGKHILCEKPLTLTLAEAERAVEACRRHGVFLQEGYMMKFHGAHRAIRRLIDDGRLGRLVYMRAQLSCWYPRIDGAWRQNPAKGGGGSLIDMATHLYDLLEYFAGPIRRVAALTGNLVQDYASEDASTTLLEFASGAQATVDSFFCIPDEASRTRLEIYGSRGGILTEGTIGQSVGGSVEAIFGLGDAAYDAAQNKDVARVFQPIEFDKINPYQAECEYFADCVLSNRAPEINNAKNALHILRVTEAAYRSARERRFVEV
ncbi:MAG: Gfo/Idh/MocA family oxidoreductase [Candidatus Sumerlaeota bacterium]|nr:Gfo/Idh/MocA family oxidoreductase [Candidatus Sumerlaeota bacterium]